MKFKVKLKETKIKEGNNQWKKKEVKDLEKKLAKYNEEISRMDLLHKEDYNKIEKIKESIFKLSSLIKDDISFSF